MYTATLILNIQNIFYLDANRITTKTKNCSVSQNITYTVYCKYIVCTFYHILDAILLIEN